MFSEKYGYKPKKQIMYESISDVLRQRIWNLFYLNDVKAINIGLNDIFNSKSVEEMVADKLGLAVNGIKQRNTVEEYVTMTCKWYEVYDFLDIYLSVISESYKQQRINEINQLLEEEKSGYRIVNGEIAPITSTSEIETIEQAANSPFNSVNEHIQKALGFYADIKNPDYENSIKESISAVEAMCCIITGESGHSATLGSTLKKLKDCGVYIHSAMEKAFSALYGYTCDENGIRHGGKDFHNVPAEDAKYMLISCSAFVNYLIEKWCKVQET